MTASARTSMHVREFLAKNRNVLMPQATTYLPGLAPTDFFLFPKLKTPIKGKRFAAIEEITEKSKEKLLATPKSTFQ